MKIQLLFVLFACLLSVHAAEPKSILFIAGKPSHGAGEHEHHAGCNVLVKALDDSGLSLKTEIHYDTWPDDAAFNGVDAVVIYADGNQEHIALGHEAELQALSDRGIGIVCLHYCIDGEPGLLNETLFNVIGGYYDESQSRNPEWSVKDPKLAEHPVTSGVQPFELHDEWYYNIKLGAVVPLLQAIPPEEGGEAHVLAWTHGTNRFGFTGGHYHKTWANPDVRKLVLNAIVWAAGMEVPVEGVESETPVIAVNKSILHAIAKGDADDVLNHILLGANVNERNKQGWTPLHFSAVRGQTECARVLIENGASVNHLTGTEKTPLHFAADRNFLELAKLLVANGAEIGARDDEGWSPLHYAAEKDRVELAAYLIEQGAEVDMRSRRGGTPLHEASASASVAMINLLLENGADKSIKATNGKTPLDYAIELNNEPAAAILK
jgi:type 1 glutamine amidotransferase